MCDGVEIREDMEIPVEGVDGLTCAEVVATAPTFDASSGECVDGKFSEALCCPSAASTCSICKGTKLYGDVVIPGTDGMTTCAEVAFGAARYEMTSANCTVFEDMEAFCCPDPEVHSSKCYLCGEDGVGEMDDVQVPNLEDGVTCGIVAQLVVAYEETSDECLALESGGALNFCCGISTSNPSTGSISSPPPVVSPTMAPVSSDISFVCGSDFDDASMHCSFNTPCSLGLGCPGDTSCFALPECSQTTESSSSAVDDVFDDDDNNISYLPTAIPPVPRYRSFLLIMLSMLFMLTLLCVFSFCMFFSPLSLYRQ